MSGFFRVEVKVVKRTDIRSDGTVGKNSALSASAYITAEKIENNPLKSAAYISGKEIRNEENKIVADYSNKKGVLYSKVVLPKEAPERLFNPEVLWSEVEKLEGRRKDSVLFREWICCLEQHLTMEQKYQVAEEYAQSLAKEGMAVQYAVHEGHDGNNNDHIHYLGTVRGFENGEWKERRVKSQEFLLDKDGNRIPVIDKSTGEQKKNKDGSRVWKKSKVKYEDAFNEMHIGNVERWRKKFAEIENQYLPDEFKVTADSYIAQGLDIIPGQHLGKSASNVQRKLEEQLKGLSEERRKDYLEKILRQVQQDYRRAFYENSRMISINKKKFDVQESSEHKNLRRKISKELRDILNYRPQKKYISNVLGMGQLQIENALVELQKFYQTQLNKNRNNPYEDLNRTIKLLNLLSRVEELLIITFSSGVTKSCENFIIQHEYEMKKILLKQLGEEIRETEKQISLLQGKEEEDSIGENMEQRLGEYSERISAIRNPTVTEAAENITRITEEIRASEDRLAKLRRRTSGTVRELFAATGKQITATTNKYKKK